MKTIEKFKPGAEVVYNGKRYRLISINLGGKCKIKKLDLPYKGRVTDVDVLEIKINL